MKIISIAALAFVLTPALPAQAPNAAPSPEAFRTSLLRLQHEIDAWQRNLAKVNVEQLPVSYAEGKIMDQQLQISGQNLKLASALVARILRENHLSDEINLMAVLGDLGRSLQEVSNALLSVNTNDEATVKKLQALSGPLSSAANGGINDAYMDTYKYVIDRASMMENKNCSGEVSR